ncbi:L,D-transpeptidase family protein [Terriglobus albidus]|uniref:L,D-transpeptidase family protein n=2 Tax=Terriglobus albidus TaxID=1592106 RepID=A0A5B9EHF8_9BACT|nr:L,D-transpeptidase family protein [Terriglobus albidus]
MLTEREKADSNRVMLFRILPILVCLLLPAAKSATASCVPNLTLSLPIQQELVHGLVADTPVAAFYRRCQFALAWNQGGHPTVQARTLAAQIQRAPEYGLRTADYPLPTNVTVPDQFDVEFTAAVLRFAHDLRCGRLTPARAKADIADTCTGFDLIGFVWNLACSDQPAMQIESLEPDAPGYRRTKAALQLLLQRSGVSVALLPPFSRTLAADDTPSLRTALLQRMTLELGDFAEGAAAATPSLFSVAMQTYQEQHGLATTGKLDQPTYTALSIPLSERVEQLGLTLERWRWTARSFDRPPIVVNIPEFRLRAYDDRMNIRFSMKVIVGGAYRRQTPVFENRIAAVEFRPYWNVPPSIQRNEILPAEKRSPGYLARHNFEVVRSPNGSTRIRQRPGEENALGLIKFSLPNVHNVYLHDTPKPELFERVRRDFSHGCIRIEKPDELAVWVLRDQDNWPLQRVQDAMHGNTSFSVKLSQSIPILIVYGTGFAAENGRVYFLNDLYGEDKRLIHLLQDVTDQRLAENSTLSAIFAM